MSTDESDTPISQSLWQNTIPRPILQNLQIRSDAQGILQAVSHFGLILTCMIIRAMYPTFLPTPLLMLQSFFMFSLFNCLHECVHMTAFNTPILNKAVGKTVGFAIFRPMYHYTCYHYAHHRHTGDRKNDPELLDTFLDVKINSYCTYALYLSGGLFWIDRFSNLARHCIGLFLPYETYLQRSKEMMNDVVTEARVTVLCYLFTLLIIPVSSLWRYWLLPSLFAQMFLRFYLLPEHTGCQAGDPHILHNTRTTSTSWWYARLAWNMPYHAEHHAFPYIPFWNLREIHKAWKDEVAKELEVAGNAGKVCVPSGGVGYIGFHVDFVKKLT
eukprot:PhF_6_TR32982/c0_g1_i2/m.48580